MALSVAEPVKNRDTSDPKASEARMPQTMNTTPTTSSVIKIILFIRLALSLNGEDLQYFTPADNPHQDADNSDNEQNMNESTDGVRGN